MQTDRITSVDQTEFGVKEADLATLAFHLEIDSFASQQPIHLLDIRFRRFKLDRADPHRASRGEACANAEIDASRGELIQRRQSVGGNRRDAVRWHEHAGAK